MSCLVDVAVVHHHEAKVALEVDHGGGKVGPGQEHQVEKKFFFAAKPTELQVFLFFYIFLVVFFLLPKPTFRFRKLLEITNLYKNIYVTNHQKQHFLGL